MSFTWSCPLAYRGAAVGDFEAYAAIWDVWGGEEDTVGVFTPPGGGVDLRVNSGGVMVSWVVGWAVGIPAGGVVAIGVGGVDRPAALDVVSDREGDWEWAGECWMASNGFEIGAAFGVVSGLKALALSGLLVLLALVVAAQAASLRLESI